MGKKTTIPWLAAQGALAVFSLILSTGDIMALLPVYLVETTLLICLGLELIGSFEEGKVTTRHTLLTLMTGVWLVHQCLLLMNAAVIWVSWLFAVAQLFMFYQLYVGQNLLNVKLKFSVNTALFIVTIFAFVKVLAELLGGFGLGLFTNSSFLWSLAVLLVGIGYLGPRQGYKAPLLKYLPTIGTLVSAYVVLSALQTSAGFTLLTIV